MFFTRKNDDDDVDFEDDDALKDVYRIFLRYLLNKT